MASYRDALTAALAGLSARQREAGARLGALRDADRAVLAEPLRAVLDAAPATIAAIPTTLEQIELVRGKLREIEDAIDRASSALSGDASRFASYAEGSLDGIGVLTNHLVAQRSGIAGAGADLDLRATVTGDDVRFVLTSRIPRVRGAISVTRQRAWQTVGKRLALTSEYEVAADEVDDFFWIDGDTEALEAVMTPEVTRLLARMRDRDPTLAIADGIARLEWVVHGLRDLNAAVFEALAPAGSHVHADAIAPPEMFELHREISNALDPPAPEPQLPRPVALREALREYAKENVDSQLRDMVPLAPSGMLASLGEADLAMLDQLAASDDPMANWAAGFAASIRSVAARDKVDAVRNDATKLAELFVRDPTVRETVVRRMRDGCDPSWNAALMSALIAADAGASFAEVFTAVRHYNESVVASTVEALVNRSDNAVVEAMLALAPPTSLDTAIAIMRFAPGSELARRVPTMTAEHRRAIVTALISKRLVDAWRPFFDDDDPEVRSLVLAAVLDTPAANDAERVVGLLRRDPDPRVRRAAAVALGRVGTIHGIRDDALAALESASAAEPGLRDVATASIAAIRRSW